MSLGPPPPHQRPSMMSPGLAGPMGNMNLGPPTSSSPSTNNGLSNGVHPPRMPAGFPPHAATGKPLGPPGAPRGASPLGPPSSLIGPSHGAIPKSQTNTFSSPIPPPSVGSAMKPPPSIATIGPSPPVNGRSAAEIAPEASALNGNPSLASPSPSPSASTPVSMPPPVNNNGTTMKEASNEIPLMPSHTAASPSGALPPTMPSSVKPATSEPPSMGMTPMSAAPGGGPPSMLPPMSTPGGPSSSSKGIPPMSTPGGPSPMGMPPMSTPGAHSNSGLPPMSTPGGPSNSGMPPMSTPGAPSRMGMPSPAGMPPMSTPGGPSPMGMPPMSSAGPSPAGMPPMSTPGGPSPMGMPPMSSAAPSPGGMPPMSTPGGRSSMGIPPMSSAGPSPGGMPPMSTPVGRSPMGMPPMSSAGPSPGGMPPMSTPGGPSPMGMPPMSSAGPSPGGMPPMSTPGGPSPMGMPPNSMPGGPSPMGLPPTSMSSGPSPMGMPPTSMPGVLSPMGMPPTSMPGGPPNSMGMPPMSSGGPSPMGMPPMSSAGGPPPMGMPPVSTPRGSSPMGMRSMSTPAGFPPMSNPGAPPSMSTPGGFPPMSTPGGFPPMSTPGMPPMPSPGGPPPMTGAPPMSTPGGFPPTSGTLPPPPGPGMNAPHGGIRPGGYPGMNPPAPGGMPPPMMGGQPGYPAQAQFGGAPASGKRALDPDDMPSPITVMEDDSKNNSGFFDTREKGLVPPLVTTKFIARDCGNASPRYIRSTMYHIPATPDLMKQCGVPFGLVISPLANISEGESEPAVTDFGPTGPVRCVRCKAYMCPFMQFVDGGRRFQCIFCKATSEVPQEYFQHLDHNGMRLDHYQRPELCMGTYEVMATKEYCRESVEPQTPGVIFAIDVSYPMIKEGVVNLVCQNMKELLRLLPVDMHCDKAKMKVGFMAYDNKINFYNIKGVLTQPQQMTVSDVHDMFVPLVDGFMVDINEAETVIDALMEQIPVLFGETRETETMLGPVIQAGKEAFKAAKCAGKLIVFHHNLPISDAPGKLKNRDDRKLLNTEKEKTVLSPQSKFYNELGQECVAAGCSVDLFLFNNAYIDIATLSQVCRLTGGQIYKYTYFQSELDGERFLSDLRHNIQRPIVFDAIMRVRTSTGVRPVDFFGSFFMANSTDTELASINSDMSVACEIKHDDKLTDEDGVYIQVALLFTSCSGQRRLRIINLSLNTGTNLADMYRSCDLDTIINFTAKQSISRLMESNPKTVKEALINNCAQILACYRRNCTSTKSVGQLILPECMKLLPLYTNCLIKSDALVGGQDVGCDERAFLMSIVSSMDVKSSVSFFYPSLIPIHDVDPNETHIPKIIRCSYEKIRDDGVYLLENGLHIFMYIGLGVDSSWMRDIFGVESPAQIDIEKVRFDQIRDNPLYKRVSGIIRDLRARRSRYMRLFFVRPKDKLDILFKHFLCEDRTGHDGNFSYVDFLCFMHKEIRALLG